jgi:phosphatidylserine/phosphatidylglycerophosphate/cardiolipin synthase-like enzyme
MVKITPAIGKNYALEVVPLVNQAKTSIDILMYEWKWYGHERAGGVQELNLAIKAAAHRKVRVRVLLNLESMGHAIHRINTRTAQFLEQAGCEVKFGQIGVATHAKMMVIDDNILVLGSHNFSKGAFTRNQEASVIIEGREEIAPYRQYFKDLWEQFF